MPSDLHDALAEGLCAQYGGKPSISVLLQNMLGTNRDTSRAFFSLSAAFSVKPFPRKCVL
jgi:hypothetical protein